MTRRWNSRGAAVLAAVLAGSLTACSGGGDSGSTRQVDASDLVSSMPAATGEVDLVKWNVTGEPDTLDPRNAVTYGGGQIMRNMCEGLMRIDADFNITEGLASSYEQVSPTELKLTIRDGVTFWDGKPLTAEDVVYSLQRSAAEDSYIALGFIFVDTIKATGPMEVTVTFTRPDSSFVGNLASLSGVVIEKAWGEKNADQIGTSTGGLMCTGPFKFGEWRPGSGITIERNDDYWNSELKPLAKQVDFSFISDDTALAQALEAGEIDGSYELPPATIAALDDASGGSLVFGPSTQSTAIAVANPGGQMADQKLRDAFQVAIDREALAKVVFSGAATPNYTHLTPETWPNDERSIYQPDYDKWAKARAFDIDKAKSLVEESGYDGSQLVLAIPAGDQSASRVAQLFQQQAKTIGVDIKINPLQPLVFDQAGYDASKRQGIDLLYGTNFNSRQNPLEPLGYDLLPGQPYNYTEYDNDEVTTLLNDARSDFDPKARAEMVVKAQEIFEPDSSLIPLVSNNTATFVNDRLSGAITSFAYWSMPQMAYVGAAE